MDPISGSGAIPMLSVPAISPSSSAAAQSGGGNVYHGDVKSGANIFVVIGAIIIVGIFAFKAGRK